MTSPQVTVLYLFPFATKILKVIMGCLHFLTSIPCNLASHPTIGLKLFSKVTNNLSIVKSNGLSQSLAFFTSLEHLTLQITSFWILSCPWIFEMLLSPCSLSLPDLSRLQVSLAGSSWLTPSSWLSPRVLPQARSSFFLFSLGELFISQEFNYHLYKDYCQICISNSSFSPELPN